MQRIEVSPLASLPARVQSFVSAIYPSVSFYTPQLDEDGGESTVLHCMKCVEPTGKKGHVIIWTKTFDPRFLLENAASDMVYDRPPNLHPLGNCESCVYARSGCVIYHYGYRGSLEQAYKELYMAQRG